MSDNQAPPDPNQETIKLSTQDAAEKIDIDAQAAGEPDDAIIDDLKKQLSLAEEKAQDNWNEFLRAKADLDNVHRRFERELEKAHKYAVEKFAQELLPVIDSLEMGMSAAKAEGADFAKVIEGTQLTYKMLNDCAEKFGIECVDPVGKPFNPEYHQAMSIQEAADKEPDTVLAVLQKGYLIHGRLIRPAMVVVSKTPAVSPNTADAVKNMEQDESDSVGSRIDEKA